jgi:cell wall-associated NlpC family hydrolase
VTTSSPQTFLDKASALDHISRSKQEQIETLRAANRELRAASAASDQTVSEQRKIAAKLAKTKASIDKDVAAQEKLLKKLEVDEAKRIAAEREAERRRQAALAAARAEKARLARIEAARRARVAAAEAARLVRAGRERQAARVAALLKRRAAEAEQAQQEADRAAADAAAAQQAADNPPPASDSSPPAPAPEPPNDGGGDRASIAVRAAMRQLGKPYQWAADGPGSFDCSGLTMYAWARAGVSLPHSSRAQFGEGRRVSRGELQPGDLVFFGSPIHHVGMYVGGGSYIAAPQTGDVVKISDVDRGDYVGGVRL